MGWRAEGRRQEIIVSLKTGNRNYECKQKKWREDLCNYSKRANIVLSKFQKERRNRRGWRRTLETMEMKMSPFWDTNLQIKNKRESLKQDKCKGIHTKTQQKQTWENWKPGGQPGEQSQAACLICRKNNQDSEIMEARSTKENNRYPRTLHPAEHILQELPNMRKWRKTKRIWIQLTCSKRRNRRSTQERKDNKKGTWEH